MGDPEKLFVFTTPGLEPVLEAEARGLTGRVEPVEGGLELEGPTGLHRRANLELRTASRVLLRVGAFELGRPEAIAGQLRALGLERFHREGPLRVRATARQAAMRADALVEVARKTWRLAPSEDEGAPELQLRLLGRTLTVSLDSSGELLHRRGYRQEVSRAPLRETLAAGILGLAGYEPHRPLRDPMCGSGTFAIEAAWIALGRAPGLERRFAFEAWPSHDAAAWEAEHEAARARIASRLPAPIFASDLDAGSLGTARRNARRAGVASLLELVRADATVPLNDAGGPGLVVANLPYGKRVGEGELAPLYAALGKALRAGLPGWRFALLLADEALVPALGLEVEEVHPLDNGGLPCGLVMGALG